MEDADLDYLIAFSSYPEREGHLEYLVNYHGAFPTSQHDEVYRGLGYSALVLGPSVGPVLFPGLLFASGRLCGVEKVESSEDLPLSVTTFVSSSIGSETKKYPTVGLAGIDIFPSLYLEEIKEGVSRKNGGKVKFSDAEGILLGQRMVKSRAEQRVMRRAAEIADIGIQAAFDATKAGARESEIGLAALRACYEEGAGYVARTRIYGRNISGVRWPIMTNRKLQRGEITGIDLVGYYSNYGFDVLRLWTVGSPSATQKDFLNGAAQLTEKTIQRIRAGMSGDDVSNITMDVAKELGRAEVASPFGHAIGLEIVEDPILLPKSRKSKLRCGAFLCVEPSLELKGNQSVHFEDEVLIKEDGRPQTISKCPKDFA